MALHCIFKFLETFIASCLSCLALDLTPSLTWATSYPELTFQEWTPLHGPTLALRFFSSSLHFRDLPLHRSEFRVVRYLRRCFSAGSLSSSSKCCRRQCCQPFILWIMCFIASLLPTFYLLKTTEISLHNYLIILCYFPQNFCLI